MKKLLSLLVALVVFTTLSAQTVGSSRFGAKLGFNLANITQSNMNSRGTFNMGLTYENRLTGLLAISSELVYSAQGAKDRVNDVTTKITLDYINIPLLVKIYPVYFVSIETGPQLGVLLSSRYKIITDDSKTSTKLSAVSNPSALDLAWAFGINLDVSSEVYLNLRYNVGITNVIDKERNSVAQLGVGMRF